MPIIDLSLAIQGPAIPLDYGYALFSSLSRIVPQLHGDRRIGVHSIRGVRREPGRLTLVPQSRLRIRMPSEEIAAYLPLVGSEIDLDGSRLRVGLPASRGVEPVRIERLRPISELTARLVTLGQIQDSGVFEASLRRQLAELGVAAEPSFLPSTDPRGRGGPERRVMRIKGRAIVGFPIRISGLTAEESLTVQSRGLGSRRRMGCGVFVPVPPARAAGMDSSNAREV